MRIGMLALLLLAGCGNDGKPSIMVFAAASLTDGLAALAEVFEQRHPQYQVEISVGPTSMLARQIQHGAPADVFIAANPDWVKMLEDEGRVIGSPRVILANRLVVVGKSGTNPLDSLGSLAGAGQIAVADPSHVPAGVYTRTSLECAGLWDQLKSQVIPTLDVRAAVVAVTSGAADLAIVYASDTKLAPELQVLLNWPEVCAPEIRYAAVVIKRTRRSALANTFVAFADHSANDALWERFGFDLSY